MLFRSLRFPVTISFLSENLNYSADGLLKIFPKYFDKALALSYARNPQKIANRVYANRMGNGDESTGDGFKFKGRGYIQLTGKSNYAEFSKYIGEDCLTNPDLVSVKYPLESAAFFFTKNKLWSEYRDWETVCVCVCRVYRDWETMIVS